MNDLKRLSKDMSLQEYEAMVERLEARRDIVDVGSWLKERTDYDLTSYQRNIFDLVSDDSEDVRKVIVRAGRGAGKTFITASVISWFIDTRERAGIEWAVQTTAPSGSVLTNVLWPAIHKSVRGLKSNQDAKHPHKLRFEGNYGMAVSQAVAPGAEVNLEGMHAPHMLIVFDESKGIRPAVWDSMIGSFSEAGINGNQAIWLAISTPGPKHGRFFEIFDERQKHADWKTVHITLDEAIEAGRISESQAEQAATRGRDTVYFQNHWLGEFYEDTSETFMPSHWMDRSFELHDNLNLNEPGPLIAGIDPAGKGADSYAIAWYSDKLNAIVKIEEIPYTESQIEVAKRLIGTAERFVIDAHYNESIIEIFRTLTDKPIIPFSGWSRSKWTTSIGQPVRNLRTAAFMNLKQMMDPAIGGNLALPDLKEVRVDVQAQKVKPTLSDVIHLYDKDWIKSKIGKSPDIADAISYAVWGAAISEAVEQPAISFLEIRDKNRW